MRRRKIFLSERLRLSDGVVVAWSAPSAGRRVLMIPGLGGDSGCWGRLPRAMEAAGLAPVLFDPRGLGGSSRGSSPLTIELLASDACEIFQQVGPCAVLGWSMGASVAFELACRVQEKVPLVFLASSLSQAPKPGTSLDRLLHCSSGEWGTFLMKALAFDGASGSAELGGTGAVLEEYRQALLRWTFRPQRALALRGPSLFLAGEDDGLVSPSEVERTAKMVPGSRYLCVKGGHGFFYRHPEETARAVSEFLVEADG